MKRWYNIVKILSFCLFWLSWLIVFAQESTLVRAQQLYQAKKIDQAKLAIDSAIMHPDTKNKAETWTIRSFIYFDMYKVSEKLLLNSSLRDTILKSLNTSNNLNPDPDYKANNYKLLNSISGHYFNIGKRLLEDSTNAEKSLQAYNKFKEIGKKTDPNKNFKTEDVQYHLAVGSLFSEKYNKNNEDQKSFEIAKLNLMKVIQIDSNVVSANSNMGIMYFNSGANLFMSIGEYDITKLEFVQDNAVKLFKQAEYFMLKVYRIDNKNTKAVEALYYIYKALNEDAKREMFKAKCKELMIKTE